MNRKRFIKTLMGLGISRDDARQEAEEMLWRNENRQERNEDIAHWRRTTREPMRLVGMPVPEAMESYAELADYAVRHGWGNK